MELDLIKKRSGSYFEGAGFDICDSDVIRSYSWKNVEAENDEESALNEEDLIMDGILQNSNMACRWAPFKLFKQVLLPMY